MTDGILAIGRLVAPTAVDVFVLRYFQKSPLFVSRGDPRHYSSLLTGSDLEGIIVALDAPSDARSFLLMRDGQSLPVRPPLVNEDGRLVISQVAASYQQGYSVIVNHLERRSASVRAACEEFERSLVADTNVLLRGDIVANAYLTPRQAQGFSPHYDNHDVFIVQLEGEKTWHVYDRMVESPLVPQSKIPREQLGAPVQTAHLVAGDLLYLPRGFPHEAATGGHHSLHLTFGVHTYTLVDLIHSLAAEDADFRRSVSCVSHDPQASAGSIAQALENLLPRLSDDRRVGQALRQFATIRLTGTLPLLGDYLNEVSLPDICSDDALCKRHGSACWLEQDGEVLVLSFPGNAVSLPRSACPAVLFMIANDSFSVSSLPDLSPEERRVLVHRLVGEGFLKRT